MKYLKLIKELFDDEGLKAKFEIPYLKGEMSPEVLAKGKNLLGVEDPVMVSIVQACPFLMELGYRRMDKILCFGFDDTKTYSDEDSVFYYFVIEITEFSNQKFGISVKARCVGNDQVIYDEKLTKSGLDFQQLISTIKRPAFEILVEFDNWLEKMFDEDYFSISDKDISIFDPRMN